jgi:hypothetical protein
MKKLNILSSLVIAVSFISCGGGGGGTDTPDPIVVTPPSAATLSFPANNEECNTGVSLNSTQSRVDFEWNASNNTTSYTLVVQNLLTNAIGNTNATTNFASVTLNKNTPYKWWVISKNTSTSETATSSEWKFYNAGDAVKSYAPFPAELVSPALGSSTTNTSVSLEWTGSDVDGDISSYDIYFGTVNPPVDLLNTTTAQKLENITVSAVNTYYWKVVTKDEENNTSTSEIFQFKVTN